MYRILIADDESDEREVIKFLLDKYKFNCEIVEATNGKKAMAILHETPVDILFTDVKMPFMDGIELASSSKDIHPHIQIVFFSGYDDFEYIKQALSLQAVDYILKPVNPSEFQKTMSAVITRTEEQKKQEAYKEASTQYLNNHLLYRIVHKTPMDVLKKEYPHFSLEFLHDYTRMFLLEFEDALFGGDQQVGDYSDAHKICELLDESCDYININQHQSLLLFKISEPYSLMYYEKMAQTIQEKMSSLYGKKCYVAISESIKGPDVIAAAYEATEGYLEQRFFFSDAYVYSSQTLLTEEEDYSEQNGYLLQAIKKDLECQDVYNLKRDIDMLFRQYQNKNLSHLYIRYICSAVLDMLYKQLPEYEEFAFRSKVENIYVVQSFAEIQTLLYQVLDKVVQEFQSEQLSPTHAIHLVKHYIHEHYGENLSLNILADNVYLSPRYLSTMFIKETGYGINKYIKNLRMDKAKELLLNTNMKIVDICKDVGYSNVSYFCKSFQQAFGVTPEKYRKKHV